MPRFTVTVRYGARPVRYHTFDVEAPDVASAMAEAAGRIPSDVRAGGDLVEIRPAPEPETRGYLGDE